MTPLIIVLLISLSFGDDSVDHRNLSLSLYGGGFYNGSWTTGFLFDRMSQDVSAPWNLRLNYSVHGRGRDRRITVQGFFIDGGVHADNPISVRLLPVEAKEVNTTGQRCYDQEDGSTITIISMKELDVTRLDTAVETRTQPAKYVIVDAAQYTKKPTESYASRFQRLYAHQHELFGGFLFNIVIGDNGQVFEGLGWDNIAIYGSGGLGPIALNIHFMKENRNDPPSPSAIATLRSLIKTAICLGKLSPEYKLIPFHLIYEHPRLPNGHFEKKAMQEWDRYEGDIDFGVNSLGQFPIVFREEWNWTEPLTPLANLSLPVELVVVRNYDERCFTSEFCLLLTKWTYNYQQIRNRPLTFNFLVGDDGRAYEVRGWDFAPYEKVLGKRFIVVGFYGVYHSYPPSRRALIGFNNLLRVGVIWGKISPDYRVASYRSINKNTIYMGDVLHKEVTKMKRFTDEI